MTNLNEYITEKVLLNKKEFCVIKPEFTHLHKEIVQFLQQHKMVVREEMRRVLSREDAKLLYSPHKKESFYNDLVEYMCSGESIGMVLTNYGGEDMDKVKDMIRKKWGKDEMKNCLHSSDSFKNVERESKIYFRKKEDM
jgi:nucleoside-diphosphate kinase